MTLDIPKSWDDACRIRTQSPISGSREIFVKIRSKVAVLAVPLSLGAVVLSGSPAYSAPVVEETSALAAPAQLADEKGFVIVEPADAQVADGATFYPTGPIADDTVVVIPDAGGSLPSAVADSPLAAQITQSAPSVEAAAAQTYAWGATSAGYSRGFVGGSVIGTTDSYRAGYGFTTLRGFNARASGQGLGFYRGYNGSEFGTWSRYYYVGNTGATGTSGTVPWGNVAATKYFRAICTQTTACGGYFS